MFQGNLSDTNHLVLFVPLVLFLRGDCCITQLRASRHWVKTLPDLFPIENIRWDPLTPPNSLWYLLSYVRHQYKSLKATFARRRLSYSVGAWGSHFSAFLYCSLNLFCLNFNHKWVPLDQSPENFKSSHSAHYRPALTPFVV